MKRNKTIPSHCTPNPPVTLYSRKGQQRSMAKTLLDLFVEVSNRAGHVAAWVEVQAHPFYKRPAVVGLLRRTLPPEAR